MMTFIRCLAVLYSYYQLRNLHKLESKYILGKFCKHYSFYCHYYYFIAFSTLFTWLEIHFRSSSLLSELLSTFYRLNICFMDLQAIKNLYLLKHLKLIMVNYKYCLIRIFLWFFIDFFYVRGIFIYFLNI